MRLAGLLVWAICAAAWAQGLGGPGLIGRPFSVTETAAAVDLYVSSTGSDGNDCTASGASACLTIQGAVNKLPKKIRHPVTITASAESFATGALISGFAIDPADATVGAWLIIQGTFATATVATGSATGTATAGAAGSSLTTSWGTLTNGGESWTTNDLRGKWLELTGGTGSGQVRLICSNTATVITICGGWVTAPANGTTYAIRSQGTTISGGTAVPILPAQNSNDTASFTFINNTGSNVNPNQQTQEGPFIIRRFVFTGSLFQAILQASLGAKLNVEQVHANAAHDLVASAGGHTILRDNFVTSTSSTLAAWRALSTDAGFTTSLRTRGNIYNRVGSIVNGSTQGGTWLSQGDMFLQPAAAAVGLYQYNTGGNWTMTVQGMKGVCASGQTLTGALISPNSSSAVAGGVSLQISSSSFDDCANVVVCRGSGAVRSSSVTGATNGVVWNLSWGCNVMINSGTTATGTSEIVIDGAAATTYAALRAAGPPKQLQDANTFSIIGEP